MDDNFDISVEDHHPILSPVVNNVSVYQTQECDNIQSLFCKI